MRSHAFVTATDIEVWANYRVAQEDLPRLIRRLVHATATGVRRVGFRAGEGVQLPGWDGNVLVDQGSAFVPSGASAWELGSGQDPDEKANEDYRKRSENPLGLDPADSTFVFVTARRWRGRDNWERGHQAEGRWRSVRAFDADSLEEWLDLAPAVHTWFSILAGKQPEDLVDIESFWAEWSQTTRPVMTPALMLSGRGEIGEQIKRWLEGPPGTLALAAESRDEAVAILASVLEQLPEELREKYLARSIVVLNPTAWRQITATRDPLVLVPRFDVGDAIARATRMNHRVLIPLGASDAPWPSTTSVPRLSTEEARRALVARGVPEGTAWDLAALARRSLMSFRRRLALRPEVQQPVWAQPEHGREIIPAMLAGAWTDGREGDREVIAALAQVPYERATEGLSRWQFAPDTPLRHIGDTWFIVSTEDAWQLLARYLLQADFDRFEAATLNVFGVPDPRFDLPDDQRWMADALGHRHRYSGRLRDGLARTLAIMGARGERVVIPNAGSARQFSAMIVRRLLDRANADWRIWASLPLRPLAEAAPDVFLDALEGGTSGTQPVVANLFTDQVDVLFSSSPHTELLWALEVLAWSPDYLGRVVLLLAKIMRLDPGGKLENRPENSLREIFLLWRPQTAATLEQRLRILDVLREREPEVAWRLLRRLLPRHHDSAFGNTVKTQFREWTPEVMPNVTRGEFWRGTGEIVDRMLRDVGRNGRRWCDLIEAFQRLPEDKQNEILERLPEQPDHVSPEDQAMIWNSLRELISAHRSFADAEWAIQPELIDRLEAILGRFEPADPGAKYGWLFSNDPHLVEGLAQEYDRHKAVVAASQLDAVRAIHEMGGITALLELATAVQQPLGLGCSVGQSDLLENADGEVLRRHLASESPPHREFARGLVHGRIVQYGRSWAEARVIEAGLTDVQRAEILSCVPADQHTWDMAEQAGIEVDKLYWRQAHPRGIEEASEVERAARKFLEHRRPFTAIALLAHHAMRGGSVRSSLSVEVLQGGLHVSPEDDRLTSSFSFQLSKLLDALESSGEVDPETLALLEWGYLPLLGVYPRDRQPRLLHQKLGREPEFFVEILKMAYRAEGEEPRQLSDLEKAQSKRAYDLLDEWRGLPGPGSDGSADLERVKAWVREARERCAAVGRGSVGDFVIGRVLSGAPVGDDGVWPHPAVRAIIEQAVSARIEDGILEGVYNGRGVTSRHPYEGGGQERVLAKRYDSHARALVDVHPRTSALLRRIADVYRADAGQQDQEAELREDLGR